MDVKCKFANKMSSDTPSPTYKTIHVNISFTRKENLERSGSWNLARTSLSVSSTNLAPLINYLLEILPCKGIS
jgi:hypothetical protein